MPGRAQEGLGRFDSPARVLLPGHGRNEQRHDFVAHELVDDRIALHEHCSGRLVEPRHQSTEGGRCDPFRQGRGTPHVGEEQRALDLRAAVLLLEQPKADAAVLGILRPSSPAHQPHQRAADASKGSRAHLAAWVPWHPLHEAARSGIDGVGPHQDRAPHLAARRGLRPVSSSCSRTSSTPTSSRISTSATQTVQPFSR